MSARVRPELGFVPLIAVVFFNVSGGPYGIEDAVSSFGPGLCLVLLVLTPLVWSLPVALAMSELAAALPEFEKYLPADAPAALRRLVNENVAGVERALSVQERDAQ